MGFNLRIDPGLTKSSWAPLGLAACACFCLGPLLSCGAGQASTEEGALGAEALGASTAASQGLAASQSASTAGTQVSLASALPSSTSVLTKLQALAPPRTGAGLFERQSQNGLRESELLAIHARSGGARAELDLGIFYAGQERSLRALSHLLRSVQLQSEAGEVWFWLGVTCALLELPEETLTCLERAQELGWWSPGLERVRGEAWSDVGQDDRALMAFEACLVEDPKDWRALLGCSRLLESNGALEPALELLVRMTQLDPEHPTPHYRSASILRRLGRMDAARQAERLHRRCAILDDLRLRGSRANPVHKRMAVGAELLAQGRPDEALMEYEDCLALPIQSAAKEAARLGKERCLSMLEQQHANAPELAGWRPTLGAR